METTKKRDQGSLEVEIADAQELVVDKLKSDSYYRGFLCSPLNPITGKGYGGVNAMILIQWMKSKNTTIPFFATFQQWSSSTDYKIKKGAKGIKVLRMDVVKDRSVGSAPDDVFQVPKWFSVFHASDVEGTQEIIEEFKRSMANYHHPIRENIEPFLFSALKTNQLKLVHDPSSLGALDETNMTITLPDRSSFEDIHGYFGLLVRLLCEFVGKKMVKPQNWKNKKSNDLGKQAKVIKDIASFLLMERFEVRSIQFLETADWTNFGSDYTKLKGVKWAYQIVNQMAEDHERNFNLRGILTFLLCQRKMRLNSAIDHPEEPRISSMLPREINMWIVSVAFPPVFFVPKRYMKAENVAKLPEKIKNKILKKPKLN